VISDADAAALGACVAAGGVAVFPADTVYGLACDPGDEAAIARLYALKGRPPDKPSATMYFDLRSLPQTGPRTRAALERLLPGKVTLILPGGLGVRVPFLAPVGHAVLQSSANLSGEPDARRLSDVPAAIREGVDLVIDGGELPGTPSTVIDLRDYEDGRWSILRLGAVGEEEIRGTLSRSAGVKGACEPFS
jgi:L-threonylcarbamoyladenylate synthase